MENFMTTNEKEMIRLIFQIHKLISEGRGNGKQANGIRERMDSLGCDQNEEMLDLEKDISSWCYALYMKDETLSKKYRRFLFEGIFD